MTNIETKLAKVAEAEALLEEAKREAQAVAMEQFRAAVDVCQKVGVQLPDLGTRGKGNRAPRSQESRERASQRMRAVWATKSETDRARWVANAQTGRRLNREAVA